MNRIDSQSVSPEAAFILFTDLPKAVPYVDAIRGLGYKVLVITQPPVWPMEKFAASFVSVPEHPLSAIDELAFAEAGNVASVLQIVRSWRAKYALKGVFSSSELFVHSAAMIADAFGLRGVGLRAASVCRDKLLQRIYLERWSPSSVLLTRNSLPEWHKRPASFPVVAKPLHLYCSIGVQLLKSSSDLDRYFERFEDYKEILVEEFVTGREYSVESIVMDGEVLFSNVTEKRTNELDTDNFVEMGHSIPAANLTPDEEQRLIRTQAEILAAMEFSTGMAHGEFRITGDGRVVLMEIAARPPGDGILQLYFLSTGKMIEESVISVMAGIRTVYPAPDRWTRQIYFEHDAGVLRDVSLTHLPAVTPCWMAEVGVWPSPENVDRTARSSLHQIVVTKERDSVIGSIRSSFDRAVTAIFSAKDVASLASLEGDLQKSTTIRVDK